MTRNLALTLTLFGACVGTTSAGDTIRLGLPAKTDLSAPTRTLQLTTNDSDTQLVHGGRHYGGGWHGYRGWSGGYGYRPYYGGYARYNFGYSSYYPRFGYGYSSFYPRYNYGFGGIYSGYSSFYQPNFGYSSFYQPYYGYSSYSFYYPPVVYNPCASIGAVISVPSTTYRIVPSSPDLSIPPAAPRAVPQDGLPAPRTLPPGQTFPYDGGPKAPVPMPQPTPADAAPPTIPAIPATPAKAIDGLPVALPKKKVTYPAYGEQRPAQPKPAPVVVRNQS